MDSVTSNLEQLKLSTEGSDPGSAFSTLEKILDTIREAAAKQESSEVTGRLIQGGILPLILPLLSSPTPLTVATAAETIAELAREERSRDPIVKAGCVPPLAVLLKRTEPEVALQACRALGNVCYENDFGRQAVMESGGVAKIANLLNRAGKVDDLVGRQLRVSVTGFLLNLINGGEPLHEKVHDLGILESLCSYLLVEPGDEDICNHIMLTFSCLADSEGGRNILISRNISNEIIQVLSNSPSSDIGETCLELLAGLAESDEVKLQLARAGLCETLVDLIREHKPSREDEESTALLKVACDIIVLVLTGDESMNHLFSGGTGRLFADMVEWLGSGDEDLQITAALAMGNFGRNDDNCIRMVEKNVTKHLLDLVKSHSTAEGDIRLQHAMLSALRNLAIPKVNKPVMLSLGLLDALVPMSQIQTFPVVFKLLGTLRMLIDGQESSATNLGENETFLSRLVGWCQTNDHPGVQGEANRLLAWIVKNSRASHVMSCIVNAGGLPYLVSMISSEHAVMQVEALLAVSIIITSLGSHISCELREAAVVEKVSAVLDQEESTDEVKMNSLTVVAHLVKIDMLLVLMQESGIEKKIEKLMNNATDPVRQQAAVVLQLFESG